MADEHSGFGGSVISRRIYCEGSWALEQATPKPPSSGYADEGSAAHELAAECLKRDLHPTHFLGHAFDDYPDWPVTQEMCDAVVVYLNAVTHEMAQTQDSQLYVEESFILPIEAADEDEVFGRADAVVYHPSTGRLRGFDYKHGIGVMVDHEDNDQNKFYLSGAIFNHPEWRPREIIATIAQPRARDNETDADAIRDWTFDPVAVLDFMGEVEEAVRANKKYVGLKMPPLEAFTTGPHCRWCDAAAVCPAREAEIMAAAQLDFTDMTKITVDDLPIVTELDTARLGQILKAGALLNDWLSTVQEYVEGLLMGGTPVEGWKVVEKIGRAKWVAAEEDVAGYAEMMWGLDLDQIRPRKLTTITDAEKLLKAAGAKKDDIDDFKLKFTIKESSGLTMAPTSDRRPAVDALANAFGDVPKVETA